MDGRYHPCPPPLMKAERIAHVLSPGTDASFVRGEGWLWRSHGDPGSVVLVSKDSPGHQAQKPKHPTRAIRGELRSFA